MIYEYRNMHITYIMVEAIIRGKIHWCIPDIPRYYAYGYIYVD